MSMVQLGTAEANVQSLQFNDEASGKRTIRELIAALGRDLVATADEGLAGIKDRAIISL